MTSVSKKSLAALEANSKSSLRSTREELELAFARLRHGNPRVVKKGTPVSVSAVADEAGVDRTTVHRFHEPVVTAIRRFTEKAPRQQLQKSRSELTRVSDEARELRRLTEEAQQAEQKAARINHRLSARIDELEEALRIRDQVIESLQRQLNERAGVLPLGKPTTSDSRK